MSNNATAGLRVGADTDGKPVKAVAVAIAMAPVGDGIVFGGIGSIGSIFCVTQHSVWLPVAA